MEPDDIFSRKEEFLSLDPACKQAIREDLHHFMSGAVRMGEDARLQGLMDHTTDEFLRLAQAEHLDAGDKMQAKIRLRAFMHEHPARASRPRGMGFFSHVFAFRLSSLAMALVLVVAAGGGVTYAAEESMPGSPLYNIKRGLNERVMMALAFDTEARAGAHARLVQRRLREIEYLALRAGGDISRDEDLRANLEFHMMTAQEQINALAKERPDAATAEAARLEAELEAHSTILTQLQPSSSPDIRPFLISVSVAVSSAAKTATETRATFEGTSAAAARISAEATIEQSERGIAEARRTLERMDDIADPRSLLRAKKLLEEAEDDLNAGKATLKAEGYGEAVMKGKSARRRAEESRVIGAGTSIDEEDPVISESAASSDASTDASSSADTDDSTSASSVHKTSSSETSATRSGKSRSSDEDAEHSSSVPVSSRTSTASESMLEKAVSSAAKDLQLP